MNTVIKRRDNGLPIPGTDVVAADLIALVSGLNFNSVIKLLTAINAISHATGKPVDDLVEYDAIPVAPADLNRRDATNEMAKRLRDHPALLEEEDTLHFVSRMSHKRDL